MNNTMKVLLCCILKLENHYLEEWVRHYKKLGIDKIVIYDNNDVDGEHIEDISFINEQISNNYIDVYKIPGEECVQMKYYNECYKKYSDEYDWLMFFDIDEFLMLENSYDLKTCLSSQIYECYDMIHVNWKCFDDNDILYANNDYRLVERFTRPVYISKNISVRDKEIKSIIRGGLSNIEFINNPHTIKSRSLRCCNVLGHKENSLAQSSNSPIHKIMWLNHYICKSLEEYCTNKLKRLGGSTAHTKGLRYNENFFWMYNIKTKEKLDLYYKLTNSQPCNKVEYTINANKEPKRIKSIFDKINN